MEANNMAAMREALEDSQSLLESFSHGEYGAQVREQMRDNGAALALPQRNCDVGTAEEQYRRWIHFCEQRLHRCENCPCNRPEGCTFTFENMPYEAEEGVVE